MIRRIRGGLNRQRVALGVAVLVATALAVTRFTGVLALPWDTGSLDLAVADLPAGLVADAQLQGPDGVTRHISGPTHLRSLPPGRYTLTVNPVRGSAAAYYADPPQSTFSVAALRTTTTTEDYFNLIPSTTHVVSTDALAQMVNHSSDYTSMTFSVGAPGLGQVRQGDILVAGISPTTPLGLLVRVTGISASAGRVQLTTTRALITDAVPRGHLHIVFNESNLRAIAARPPSGSLATASGSPVGTFALAGAQTQPLSLSINDLSSTGTAAGSSRFAWQTLTADATSTKLPCLHGEVKPSFGATFSPLWAFDVKFDVTNPFDPKITVHQEFGVDEKVVIGLKAAAGIECSLKWEPFDQFFAPETFAIGPVPVVVQPEVALDVELEAKILHDLGEVGVEQTGHALERVDVGKGYSRVSFERNFHAKPTAALKPLLSPGDVIGVGVAGEIGPRFQITLYGLAGPAAKLLAFSNFSAPDPEHKVQGEQLPWSLYAGVMGTLELNLGPHFGLGPLKLDKSFALPIAESKWIDVQVAAGSPPPHASSTPSAANSGPSTALTGSFDPNTSDACSLLTSSDVQQIGGGSYTSEPHSRSGCIYRGPEPSGQTPSYVTVDVFHMSPGDYALEVKKYGPSGVDSPELYRVFGIGDAAYQDTLNGHGINPLVVFLHGFSFAVSAQSPEGVSLARERQAAQLILKHLTP